MAYTIHHAARPPTCCAFYDWKKGDRTHIGKDGFFVFGSNLAGHHGAGAALAAHKYHGAELGKGIGYTGKSYAIPTKDKYLQVLDLWEIEKHIRDFVLTTQLEEHNWFWLTPIGTGYANYHHHQIAPLFQGVENCWLPREWQRYLKK